MAKDCFEDEHDDEDDQTEGWKDGRMEGCSQTQEESARIFLLVTEPNDSSDGTDVSAEVRPLPAHCRTKAEAVPPVKAKIGENTRDYLIDLGSGYRIPPATAGPTLLLFRKENF